jgi:hypothetical protein
VPKNIHYTSTHTPIVAEDGLPQAAYDVGIETAADWQTYQQTQLTNKQIASQTDIANQQEAFNEQQLQQQKDIAAQQQQAVDDQAQRQNTYDQGRADLLAKGSQSINDAFAQFTPAYYDQYAKDYMSKAQDDINYQKQLAQKQMMFGMARQGLINSQALVNTQGQLDETSGRATAEQTANAQSAEANLKANVGTAKQNLLGQVTNAESTSSPIASGTLGGVNTALQTQQNAITGITNTSGDVTASLKGVPTVSPLIDIFSGVLGGIGSYLSGGQANQAMTNYNNALLGKQVSAPNVGSATIR